MYLQAMVDVGCEPFYRLGESIDHTPKKKYIHPPKDFAKWARICEHIIRHYNEGWADGFHFGIKYWEIWNEPDQNGGGIPLNMWSGTPEQFYELYRVTANHLKNCFGDSIKVGGYGSVNLNALTDKEQSVRGQFLLGWANDFMAYINAPETWAPLDFFSYHKYTRDPYEIFDYHTEIRKWLDSKGREKAELILDEWNLGIFAETDQEKMAADDAARIAYVLLSSQKSPADMLMYYDIAKIRPTYNRLVSADKRPYSSYYSFAFFGALYTLGTEVDSGAFERGCDVTLCAARNHKKGGIFLANITPEAKQLELTLKGTEDFEDYTVYLMDRSTSPSVPTVVARGKVKENISLPLTGRNSIVYISLT